MAPTAPSCRSGTARVSALEFREQGYLPEALCNYLLRLGWGHGDAEVLDRDEAIRLFDLDGVGRAPSRMDYAKLTNLNGIYIRHADDDRLTREVLERLAHRTDLALGARAAERIRALMPALKERAKTLVELADAAAFLARPLPLPMEPKAASLLTPEARLMLRDVAGALAATDFTPSAIDARAARVCRGERAEAWAGGTAAARGADRQHGQSRHRRDPGGAGQGRGVWRGSQRSPDGRPNINSATFDLDQCRGRPDARILRGVRLAGSTRSRLSLGLLPITLGGALAPPFSFNTVFYELFLPDDFINCEPPAAIVGCRREPRGQQRVPGDARKRQTTPVVQAPSSSESSRLLWRAWSAPSA